MGTHRGGDSRAVGGVGAWSVYRFGPFAWPIPIQNLRKSRTAVLEKLEFCLVYFVNLSCSLSRLRQTFTVFSASIQISENSLAVFV